MIDEGETDWKVIAINVDDPDAANYNGKKRSRVWTCLHLMRRLTGSDGIVNSRLQTEREWGSKTFDEALLFLTLSFYK